MYMLVVILIDALFGGLAMAHFSLINLCQNENGIRTQAELQAVSKFLFM